MDFAERNDRIAHCPSCGDIPLENVAVYNEGLRKQTFGISPILPTCRLCGSEVALPSPRHGGRIILLNGTCASGKSATAEEFMRSHGFLPIDGDCVIQVVKYKLGSKKVDFDSDEFFEEINREIDILLCFGRDIVLSHIVMPSDIQKYKMLFAAKRLDYVLILLRPDYDTAVRRSQTRTCHTSITPEEWVRYFYERLTFGEEVTVFDNTNYTVEQAAHEILAMFKR